MDKTIAASPTFRQTLKRRTIAAAILLAIFVVLWLCWAHVATTRLQAKLDELKSQGQPIFPADFAVSVPDDRNAGRYFAAAAAAVSTAVDCPANSNMSYTGYPPFPRTWHQAADASLIANRKALALARQARPFDHAALWPVPKSHIFGNLNTIPSLNSMRALANVLGDAALQTHGNGNDAEAMEYLLDLFHQTDSMNESGYLLVHRLVAIGIDALAIHRLEVITADNLQVKDAAFPDAPTTQPTHPVDRLVIENLIRRLSDEHRPQIGMFRILQGERVASMEMSQIVIQRATVLRPMLKMQELGLINYYETVFSAANQPDRDAALAVLNHATITTNNPSHFYETMLSILAPVYPHIMETEYRVEAERRVAAISLAARLYRCDHGNWPPDLNALVPKYLPKVPNNPFLDPVRPMQYILAKPPNAAERPMIYFDTTSKTVPLIPPSLQCFGWQTGGGPQWRDLSMWTLAPSTQASNHNSQQAN